MQPQKKKKNQHIMICNECILKFKIKFIVNTIKIANPCYIT